MTAAELTTAVQEGANVKVAIMNNNFLGMVRKEAAGAGEPLRASASALLRSVEGLESVTARLLAAQSSRPDVALANATEYLDAFGRVTLAWIWLKQARVAHGALQAGADASGARRLMLTEGLEAAAAAHRVGYESPSQFSREYARLFGVPPARAVVVEDAVAEREDRAVFAFPREPLVAAAVGLERHADRPVERRPRVPESRVEEVEPPTATESPRSGSPVARSVWCRTARRPTCSSPRDIRSKLWGMGCPPAIVASPRT